MFMGLRAAKGKPATMNEHHYAILGIFRCQNLHTAVGRTKGQGGGHPYVFIRRHFGQVDVLALIASRR